MSAPRSRPTAGTGAGRATGAAGDPPAVEPRADAVAHLQQAAIEVIAAAHAVLDLAEDVVRSPAGLGGLITGAVAAFRHLVTDADGGRAPAPGTGDGPGAGRVQHIRIS